MFHRNAQQFHLFLIMSQFQMKKMIYKKGGAPSEQQTLLYDKITKIEVEALQRIQKLKNSNKYTLCEHFNLQSQICQPYDQNVNYYDRFWKRLMINEIGRTYAKELQQNLQSFSRKLQKIDGLFTQWEKLFKPVTRGKQKQSIMKEFQKATCHACGRTYKDEQTLMLHVRIKHEVQDIWERAVKQKDSIFQEQNQ